MRITVDATLLGVVQCIAPVIREYKQEAEHRGRLSQPVVEALAGASLFRMLTPQSLGGLEVDPLTCARIIEEVSRADSAAGWALVNPSAYAWFCARLPDRGAEEIFRSHPDVLIAGPLHPLMHATPVKDGYCLTGRAPFVSNCHDATWFAVIARVVDANESLKSGGRAPEVIMAFCASDDCENP